MKNVILFAAALATLSTGSVWAQETVNLTPLPKEINVGTGTLTLPQSFSVNLNGLADSVKAEALKFVASYTKASGADVTIVDQADEKSIISLNLNPGASKMGPEAYRLKVTEKDITIEAETTRGFFYAFQSLKKLLPPCVMAEVKDPNVTQFIVPVVDINDAPRFAYRGYMLDICRHFFTVEELKRILNVMSYYKMNKFHWHLTEDQGWRVEIKKYPKLTSVGSVRDKAYCTEYVPGGQGYYTFEPYGPYFYTQEEIKEVVRYAQDLHIDIIPEVDMPGHFTAAMVAYPEFSCYPDGHHSIPIDGGVYSDILNVANPKAVQFAMDIMDELMDLFPYPYFHIGGDECPTTAWENNKMCQDLKKELGLKSFRQLQSHFIKQLAEHAAKRGRKLYVWNEAITAKDSDLEVMKKAGATVMCWTGADAAAQKAAGLGLNNVLTPQPALYINRKAGTDPSEPSAAGNGTDATLEKTYNYSPANGVAANLQKYYTGVQGTFWTEHVSDPRHLEYLTFPRLIAVAETGWSPKEKKNFNDFVSRMKKDTVLLNYNNYHYAPYYLKDLNASEGVVLPYLSTADNLVWYRIVTMASDASRNDQCIELLREGASQISQYGGNGAKADVLWSGAAVAEGNEAYDYQMWALMEDPQNKGKYALVCKAFPNGSVNPTASASDNTGRWSYDKEARHYNFTLNTDQYYGKNGNNYYYALKSDKYDKYMNMAAAGQGFSINLWNDPSDSQAGLWEFQAVSEIPATLDQVIAQAIKLLSNAQYYEAGKPQYGMYDKAKGDALKTAVETQGVTKPLVEQAMQAFVSSLAVPQNGDQIRISNAVEGNYKGLSIADKDGQLRTLNSPYGSDVWVVESSESGSFALKNLLSGKYMMGTARPLSLGTEKTTYSYSFNTEFNDFTLMTAEKKALFPVSDKYGVDPGAIYVDGVRPLGAAWNMNKVWQVTYECVDEQGNNLGTFHQAANAGEDFACAAPEITNFEVVGYGADKQSSMTLSAIAKNEKVQVVYKRVSYTLTCEYRDENGYLIDSKSVSCKLNEATDLQYPEIPYFTFKEASIPAGQFTPTKDETIVATYTTEASCLGFKAKDAVVTKLEAGKNYLLYNTKIASDGRNGLLYVEKGTGKVLKKNVNEGTPEYVWTLEAVNAAANQFKVKNSVGKYIPALPKGGKVTLSANGDKFTFTQNADKETWKIKGTNGMFWNGNPGDLTGWTEAHDFKVYTFVIVPYFEVKCSYVDAEGNAITKLPATVDYVKAGNAYALNMPKLDGYEAPTVNVTDAQVSAVGQNLDIQVVYKKTGTTGIEDVEAQPESNGKLYDLNGRVLEKANVHGVYIENGQKVVK